MSDRPSMESLGPSRQLGLDDLLAVRVGTMCCYTDTWFVVTRVLWRVADAVACDVELLTGEDCVSKKRFDWKFCICESVLDIVHPEPAHAGS